MSPAPPQRNGLPFACVLGAWHAHEAELHGYLRHRLHDPALADDLLQDVFVKAMRQGEHFCALDQPRAWLFQVARHALIDRQRTLHPTEPLPDDLPAEPAPAPTALDRLADQIGRVLPRLDPADEAVLRACDLAGQRQQDFADAHGLSLSAVKSRLLRARQRLRAELLRHCTACFDAEGRLD
ncbi:sigma-70 family RNA polymerase sigma factor [Sphaerotilus sp.]|uniref:sigma-70 family RNA polymerase sigma factor n=1 Tax=Sphaerotilus sp. TaxID=2093942 RepID=UPI002ACD756B|nr:sigma-70 family RNA polymerase sigma factor [Sphaerotilus sp.]MDZ7855436.1 sigma-70 family RNA polymerase sigma factor [Sphaerotilus sp.]